MTKRTLLLTSVVGGVLAALIVGIVGFIIGGKSWSTIIIAALLIGLGSGMGLFYAFKNRSVK